MKKKGTVIFLFLCMLLSLVGLVTVVISRFDVISAGISGGYGIQTKALFAVYITVALFLTCWMLLFVIFVRAQSGGKFFDYGKRDSVTGLGNIRSLERKYKKAVLNPVHSVFVAYFAFEPDKMLRIFKDSLFFKVQKGTAELLSELCNDDEGVTRVEDGAFAITMCCESVLDAQKRALDIVNKLNQYECTVLLEVVSPFRCGFYHSDNVTFETALQNAGVAYQHAVSKDMDVCIFSESIIKKTEAKDLLKKKLLNAIKNEEFEVFLQLIYDVKKNKFTSAEALSRWNSPEDGFVMPLNYIKKMYSVGIIEEFDLYILEKTCGLLEQWSRDERFKDLSVSCNITRVTISSLQFLDNMKKILKKYKFNRRLLTIEVTEDALINDKATAYKNIVGCRGEGIQIALDDFGAGSSSFSDINNYPIDQIKVDRQFVLSALNDRGNVILKSFVDMAHNLDIDVVCEGIEAKEQLNCALSVNTDFVQGHYYSYVYPIDEAQSHYLESIE